MVDPTTTPAALTRSSHFQECRNNRAPAKCDSVPSIFASSPCHDDLEPTEARHTSAKAPILAGTVLADHELPLLPYGFAALQPVISENTLRVHYGKHHKGYIDELNKLVVQTEFAGRPLDEVVRATVNKPEYEGLFHNAAQAWNHGFYWRSLKPRGGGDAPCTLQPLINSSFGDTGALKREWQEAATSQFGSGWAWLAYDGESLRIVRTSNAGSVLTMGLVLVLAIDVWEHAYYLDYKDRRAEYVESVLDKLINWQFAESNLLGG